MYLIKKLVIDVSKSFLKSDNNGIEVVIVLLFVLIIACLFNVVNKLVHKASMEQEVKASAEYIQQQQSENK